MTLSAISSCFINYTFAKSSYYIISIRRNSSDVNYDDASTRIQMSIDEVVNDRMNDIYEIIYNNKDTYVSDGEMDEKVQELETSPLRKRDHNDEGSDEETDIKIKKKFKFINKNRKSKSTSQNVSEDPNVQYTPIESQIVSHICPVLNYYTVKAYLSDEALEQVKRLPNVISWEKVKKLKKPTFKRIEIPKSNFNKSNKTKRASTFYDLDYIKKETGWSAVGVQTDASVHLSVLSQYNYNSKLVNNFDYNYYYPASGGQFIDMYFIDEGITVNHLDFKLYEGKTFERTVTCDMIVVDGELQTMTSKKKKSCSIDGKYQDHGTSTASVGAGYVYGVAKRANIHMIATDFYDFDFIVALDYIKTNGKPYKSVINVSRNGVDLYSETIQNKINELVDAGFIIFASAGNEAEDACDKKYRNKFAGYDNIISVGATFSDYYNVDGAYTEAYYSNYGECIDVHAPGYVVTADFAKCSSDEQCQYYSAVEGTSFSSPIVAGLGALIMSENPNTKYTYSSMRKAIIDMSVKNIIKELGSSKTPNRFANNGKHIVYSPDRQYNGCGILAGNSSCSSGCCTKDGQCIDPSNDKDELCKSDNGCQSEFGICDQAITVVDPVDTYGMSLNTVKNSLNVNANFESVFLANN